MSHLNKINTSDTAWSTSNTDLIAIGIFKDHTLTEIGHEIDRYLSGSISSGIECEAIKGKEGECNTFFNNKKRFLLLGLGERKDFNSESLRKAGGHISKYAIQQKCSTIFIEALNSQTDERSSMSLSEGLVMGSYQFSDYQSNDKKGNEKSAFIESVDIFNGDSKGISKGSIAGQSVCFSRDLGNHPGNVATPTYLGEKAKSISEKGGMKCTIFERDQFTDMGMGSFAGVALGSDEPPKFILLEYFGGNKDDKPICLVGKGLTFDSGGISLKPGNKMDEMKYDMCGSAVVLGVMNAVALLKPKLNVVAAIPSTENMPGGKACKPGDILTAYNGKTIEILNTDAEGRLILADALSYISKHYDPKYILDFATLTGAVIVALGHIATGIMGTDETLINNIKSSSINTGEKVWEFPLWDEYCKQVKSKIADVKNLGAPGQAGTIAGGAFLKEFVDRDIPWVHFDIAGTAWGAEDKPYTKKNSATGAVVRLVLDLMGL